MNDDLTDRLDNLKAKTSALIVEPSSKPLPATTILLDNVASLLVHLHGLKAQGRQAIAIDDVERLLATGRLS